MIVLLMATLSWGLGGQVIQPSCFAYVILTQVSEVGTIITPSPRARLLLREVGRRAPAHVVRNGL